MVWPDADYLRRSTAGSREWLQYTFLSELTVFVQVACDPPMNHSYWDFSLIDPMTEDFMNATKNHTAIINFSTIPAWLYKTEGRVVYPDNPGTYFDSEILLIVR